ncbi:MAG: carbohydrate kinase family protein [Byssovorax cruenta]
MLDVLLPSAYFCDLIFTGLPDVPRLGDEVFCQGLKVMPGAGFIPAVALTRLGLDVGWACDFGSDFFSRYVLEEAGKQKLNPQLFQHHDRPLQAVTVAYSFAHDRAFLSYIDPLPPMNITQLVRNNPARCLLLMSFQFGSDLAETIDAAHSQGTLVFMDAQVSGDATLADPEVAASLRSIDIFAPNQKEALRLTGEQTIGAALRRLAELTPTVVIKLGADGAIAQSKGHQVHIPALPVNAVDTTGAGDNFDCGFLYGWLKSYSLEDCLRCGNFCGSRSITAHGGWDASPTSSQLENYLDRNIS